MITCFSLWRPCFERSSFHDVSNDVKCPVYIDLGVLAEPHSTYLV